MIKKQILILEVNRNNFDLLDTLLTKNGFTCKAVLNATDFNKAKKTMHDNNLILVNIAIDFVKPAEIIKESRLDTSVKIPTIFIDSALEYSRKKLRECFEAEASDYIKKPFESFEIVSRVTYHCGEFLKLQEHRLRVDKLANLATIDQLSKLTSKMQMQVILKHQIKYFNRYKTDTTIVYFSLVNINKIIGMFGLSHGEKVISLFGKELKSLMRDSDILARWEGSDFLIVLTNTSQKIAETFIKKINYSLVRAESLQELKLEVAFGITSLTEGDNVKTVLERAKYALEEAKKQRYGKIFIV